MANKSNFEATRSDWNINGFRGFRETKPVKENGHPNKSEKKQPKTVNNGLEEDYRQLEFD